MYTVYCCVKGRSCIYTIERDRCCKRYCCVSSIMMWSQLKQLCFVLCFRIPEFTAPSSERYPLCKSPSRPFSKPFHSLDWKSHAYKFVFHRCTLHNAFIFCSLPTRPCDISDLAAVSGHVGLPDAPDPHGQGDGDQDEHEAGAPSQDDHHHRVQPSVLLGRFWRKTRQLWEAWADYIPVHRLSLVFFPFSRLCLTVTVTL